ncbi:MAG TPA: ATP-binding protein [Methanospirillum sp.]|uniref:ATP-binding protein n=1 Tax=Methanospirillum sp. TaxID=45200 RepID=UPI002B6692AE|nr:ATP-binding protein [Methanospirillum sp.]HWQ63542.1 ATP-binding protein [Methanospirillum sp.]
MICESEGIVVPATIDAIEEVAQYLEECLEQADVPLMEMTRIQLAVEEAVTNVVTHGYESPGGNVSVRCVSSPELVTITITDTGPAFDPTKIPPADVTADLDHRNIGGLGVHLIRSVMDEITYNREMDANQLTLVKHISTA